MPSSRESLPRLGLTLSHAGRSPEHDPRAFFDQLERDLLELVDEPAQALVGKRVVEEQSGLGRVQCLRHPDAARSPGPRRVGTVQLRGLLSAVAPRTLAAGPTLRDRARQHRTDARQLVEDLSETFARPACHLYSIPQSLT